MRKTCKVCGKHKKVPATMQKGVDPSDFVRDPYCSRQCAELDHGVSQSGVSTSSAIPKKAA